MTDYKYIDRFESVEQEKECAKYYIELLFYARYGLTKDDMHF